jgi:hypothetical protein
MPAVFTKFRSSLTGPTGEVELVEAKTDFNRSHRELHSCVCETM